MKLTGYLYLPQRKPHTHSGLHDHQRSYNLFFSQHLLLSLQFSLSFEAPSFDKALGVERMWGQQLQDSSAPKCHLNSPCPRACLHCGHIPRACLPCGHVPRDCLPCGHVPRACLLCGHVPRACLHCGHVPRARLHCGHISRACLHCGHVPRACLHWHQVPRAHLHCGHVPRACLHWGHVPRAHPHCGQVGTPGCQEHASVLSLTRLIQGR